MRRTRTRDPGRRFRKVASAILAAAVLVGMSEVTSGSAVAATVPQNHDPVGTAWTFTPTPGGVTIRGWAFDPDGPTTNVTVVAVLDGTKSLARTVTDGASLSTTTKHHTGPTPVFVLDARVPTGKHTICVVFKNVGVGTDSVRSCTATPLGTTLTSAQRAAHSPVGAITSAWANAKSLHFRGWTSDPDYLNRPATVVLYVDGAPVSTVATVRLDRKLPVGSGKYSKFDILVKSSVATHIGCIWVVNVGLGANASLGCRAVDNRSPLNATPPLTAAPALNAKVLALATKQIGKPYVYGAAGPNSFDCSGLVMWSYGKYKVQTPRISQDQRKVARLIPASHVQPGDLVFYNDSVGDVYHVGIYQKPGTSVAAIEPGRGVDYQQLWDPTLTYGSFTHT